MGPQVWAVGSGAPRCLHGAALPAAASRSRGCRDTVCGGSIPKPRAEAQPCCSRRSRAFRSHSLGSRSPQRHAALRLCERGMNEWSPQRQICLQKQISALGRAAKNNDPTPALGTGLRQWDPALRLGFVPLGIAAGPSVVGRWAPKELGVYPPSRPGRR